MNKKQIGIIIVSGIVAISLTIGIMYVTLNRNKSDNKDAGDTKISQKAKTSGEIKVGTYTLKLGNYVGTEEEYNPDTDTLDKKDVSMEITETMIKIGENAQTYTVSGSKLITSSKLEYEVIANNKIKLLAGGGVEYEYKE